MDFTVTIGSTKDQLVILLTKDGLPFDLTGTTALVLRTRSSGFTRQVDMLASIASPATAGKIVHTWTTQQYPPPGIYAGQVIVTQPTGVSIFPNTRHAGQHYYRFEFIESIPSP